MANRFFGNWIVRNILGAAAFVLGLVLVVNIILAVFTQHGKTYPVPDMTNLSVKEAGAIAGKSGLRVEVADSVYVRRMKRGAVFSQNPKPGSEVKKGRKVSLTINSVLPKKVTMPSLVGFSMRQAKAELSSRGLNLGKLIYVNDMATNNVLRQLCHNRQIEPGTEIESGTSIDLVVGLNSTDNVTYIPDVMGLKYLRAVDAIQDNSLNVGGVLFAPSIVNYSDSLNAVVVRQSPSAETEAPLPMGSSVTLYLDLPKQNAQ